VEVVVEDNGFGMSKEVLEKALDPFFTTKDVGKGTGLGLSTVYATVKAHEGDLDLKSEPGHGTRVSLRFPACEAEPSEPVCGQAIQIEALHRALRVFVVDDDELIQSSMQTMLDQLGHSAIEARSGEEALARLEARFEPDLIILDMNMPGLGGIGTLPRLRALRPDVPILLATGRADQTSQDLMEAHPNVTLLPKPFGIDELKRYLGTLGRDPSDTTRTPPQE
jgi:CheY-like chemotaxis protein